ncbi:MAG: NAD(+)/NADH kinase [Faecousia sp.]
MKHVVMTPNPYRDRTFRYAREAEQILRAAGISSKTCLSFDVDKNFELPEDMETAPLDEALKEAECLICFGGDGTILHASKAASAANVPILGVNIGTLGFMAELESGEIPLLARLATDEYQIDERMMLHVCLRRDGNIVFEDTALNDAVITKGAVARVIQISASFDEVEAIHFNGDGIVVATPTGSTAYSMSAGGPVVEPSARNILLTPICAHDMQTRGIVVSAERKVRISVGRILRRNAFLSVDGGRAVKVFTGDTIEISASRQTTRLIHLKDKRFFEIIKNKLNR